MEKLIGPAAFKSTCECPNCKGVMSVGTVCRNEKGTPYADASCPCCGYYIDSYPGEGKITAGRG